MQRDGDVMRYDKFEILAAFCEAAEWASDPDLVYRRMVCTAARYLECESAHIHLLEFDGYNLMRCASYFDPSVVSTEEHMSLTADVGRMASLVDSADLIVMDYLHPHDQDVIPDLIHEIGLESGVSIPLNTSSGVVGMLTLGYNRAFPWGEDDHGFLLQLGRALGALVQRIQMSKKDLELQMLRERKRLSSEIHDTVSQMVSALAIHADIAGECLVEEDVAGAESEVSVVADQARKITKILRQEMLSLRETIEGEGDLEKDSAGILERFEAQWGCEVVFSKEGAAETVVAEYARLQLSRIVNECLQNVVRHARATSVAVKLRRENGSAVLTIADNGVGFDPTGVAPERLGIRIMHERAASIGGSISLESSDRGTTVSIKAPIMVR